MNPQAVAIPELLRDLLTAVGPSGHEEPAAARLARRRGAFAEVDERHARHLVRARRAGRTAPTLAVIGHIDEIGIAVTHIDGDGLLSFSTLGGFEPEMLAGQRVVIAGRERARSRVSRFRACARGASAASARDLAATTCTSTSAPASGEDAADAGRARRRRRLARRAARAAERPDRLARRSTTALGAYAALEAARRVAEDGGPSVDVVAVASVQEEIGHDGARAAAFALEPDVAIVIDVTYATDVPGERRRARRARSSSAPARRSSAGPVANRHVSDLLVAAAEEDEIPHTIEVWTGRTHTDADDVHAVAGRRPDRDRLDPAPLHALARASSSRSTISRR